MKKILSLLCTLSLAILPFQGSFATSTVHIDMQPGWNTFSTPQALSDISFSNDGEGLSFFNMEGGSWSDTSLQPTVENITPLEGFMVYNDTDAVVTISLTLKPADMEEVLHQKTLPAGWNIIGTAHDSYIANPLSYTAITGAQALDYFGDSGYASVVDFTPANFGNSNNSNAATEVNTRTSAAITGSYFQEFKAYAIFINEDNAPYGGTQAIVENTLVEMYAEEDGQNAFDLTEKFADIEYEEYDFGNFITSINGLAGDASHFWSFSVNDEVSFLGATDVTLDEGDKVSWIYTSF